MVNKKLSAMTLPELWQLFPIYLTEHQDCWRDWYEEEVKSLKKILPTDITYYHIGSTAIKGIWSKPIIDILLVIKSTAQMATVANILQKNNYLVMSLHKNRIALNKGYTEHGYAEKVFHLHLRLANDIDEIYFCHYLNQQPAIAKQYEALKLQLWRQHEYDRDAYTNAKSEFVKKYTQIAKQKY